MARPRKITDEQLLAAAGTVISRLGPGFTLADVAAEAQVAAGTLVHRFGSRHGLLVALAAAAAQAARDRMTAAAAAAGDPVAAVKEALLGLYAPLDDPLTAARNLAQLAADLADDELRARLGEFHVAVTDGLCLLLSRARAGGMPPAAVAARILAAAADGTALHWSVRPEGSLRERMSTDLGAILAGWRGEQR